MQGRRLLISRTTSRKFQCRGESLHTGRVILRDSEKGMDFLESSEKIVFVEEVTL